VDPTIIRLVWILSTLLSLGIGILLYLIAWVLIPTNPGQRR
jgi:phage shock protein PspC (stress-responsive transcriptional regulator)